MISKELLSEVLDVDVKNTLNEINGVLQYETSILDNGLEYFNQHVINIYELAHRCKEWAWIEGYGLSSRIYVSHRESERSQYLDDYDFEEYKTYYAHIYKGNNNDVIKHTEATTEPEAIFKACEWIKENR